MSDKDIPPQSADEASATEPASNPVETELSTLDIHQTLMREASDPMRRLIQGRAGSMPSR